MKPSVICVICHLIIFSFQDKSKSDDGLLRGSVKGSLNKSAQKKKKNKGGKAAVQKKGSNASSSSSEALPVPQAQIMNLEKPPTNKAGHRVGGAGFKLPSDSDDGDRLYGGGLGDRTTDKIPFDIAYPKTHDHTLSPRDYEEMQVAMKNAEYERLRREKDKKDWSEFCEA